MSSSSAKAEAKTSVQKPCRLYRDSGGCRFGDSCKFLHEKSNSQAENSTRSFKNTSLCKYYLQGKCSYGERCRFPHQLSDNPDRYTPSTSNVNESRIPNGNGGSATAWKGHAQSFSRKGKEKATDSWGGLEHWTKPTIEDFSRHGILVEALQPTVIEPSSFQKTMGDGTVSVVYGPGFRVMELTTLSTTSSAVVINGAIKGTTASEICKHIADKTEIYIPQHTIRLKEGEDNGLQFVVRFRDAGEADTAVKKLQNTVLKGARLACHILAAGNLNASNAVIFCSWFKASKSAFVDFPTDSICREASQRKISLNGTPVKIKIQPPRVFRGVTRYSALLHGLDLDASYSDVMEALYDSDLSCFTSIKINEPKYTTPLSTVIENIRNLFEQQCKENCNGSVRFEAQSQPTDERQKAIVKFSDMLCAERVYAYFLNRKLAFLGDACLNVTLKLSFTVTIPRSVYAVIMTELKQLENLESSVTVQTRSGERSVWMAFSGTDRKVISRHRINVLKLTRGTPVRDEEGRLVWDTRLSSLRGREALKATASAHGLYLFCDSIKQCITIYGSPRKIIGARDALLRAYNEFLDSLLRPVDFRFKGFPDKCEKEELLEKLRRVYGDGNVSMGPSGRGVVVRCMGSDYSNVRKLLSGQDQLSAESAASDCVACFCEADDPITTACKHIYCTACFRNFIANVSQTRTFPVVCFGPSHSGNGGVCNQPITIGFIKKHCSKDELESLASASLNFHIQSCTDKEYYFCPTPDCSGILKSAKPGRSASRTDARLQTCPQCLIATCRVCRDEAHPGQPCEDEEDDRQAEAWMKSQDVRQCPGCRANIQKNEGCNHMTCAMCKVHFCWICGEEKSPDIIYRHIPECTGPKQAAVRAQPAVATPAGNIGIHLTAEEMLMQQQLLEAYRVQQDLRNVQENLRRATLARPTYTAAQPLHTRHYNNSTTTYNGNNLWGTRYNYRAPSPVRPRPRKEEGGFCLIL